jgi:hypothetical protein
MGRDKSQKSHSQKKGAVLGELREDIRSLNSSILVIGQKMKYLVRNAKILGRNLIVLNKKLKNLEENISSGAIGKTAGAEVPEGLLKRLEESGTRINELEAELASLKQGLASQEQLQELKYVIDSINPLELATLEQVKDLIDEKTGKTKNRTDGFDFIGRDYWTPPEHNAPPALLAEAPYTVWKIRSTGNTGLTFILQITEKTSLPEKTVDCIKSEKENAFIYRIGRNIVYFNNETQKKNKILNKAGYPLKGKAGTVNMDTGETVYI